MRRRPPEKGFGPDEAGYAVARSRKRQAVRERIHQHVLHPIDTPSLLRDPLYHPSSPIDSTIGSLKLLLTAVAVHGFIILVFSVVNDLMGEQGAFKPPESVIVRVVETVPPPPPPPPVIEEEEVIEAPIQPDFVPVKPETPKASEPKKPKEPRKPKVVRKPDPKPVPEQPAAPPPPVRRHIGISFESTTTGGKGPSLGVGTSRMGQSESTAADPKVASQEPVGPTTNAKTGTGSGSGPTATREQRKATNIPTRDSVFVKPRRSKPSKPPYPTTLKAQGIEGDVQVRVSIDARGLVTKVTILKGSGHSAFDQAARDAAMAEVFTPATRDGKAVAYTLSYSYRFRIEEN